MHGCYEDITKVDFTLAEPSQMIKGSAEDDELWLAADVQATLRSGKLRSLLGADSGFS